MLALCSQENSDVVEVELRQLPFDKEQYDDHGNLERGGSVLWTKPPACDLMKCVLQSECCLFLVRFYHFDLLVAAIHVQFSEYLSVF